MDALVGDLPDDDHPDYMITSRDDGTWWVEGRVPFVDFIEYFDISKTYIEDAEDRYTTVAGLCLDILQKIPKQGDTFEWNGFKFEIADMDSARVDKLLVRKSETTT
jgi:putative hemolysin